MDTVEQLALTGHIAVRASRAAFVRPLLVVTLVAFAVPALVAVMLANFAHPLLSPLMLPVVTRLGSPWAVHYPGTLIELPAMLGQLGRVTEWLTMTLVLGWAGTSAMHARRGVSVVAALLPTLQRLPRLLLVGAPLTLVWGAVARASVEALMDLHRKPISAAAHFAAAGGLEATVLAAGASLLPVILRGDLPLRDIPAAVRRAWRWGGVALPGFAIAMVAAAWVGRIVCVREASRLAVSHPDVLLFVALAAAMMTALGLVVFGVASVLLAPALDEGWS